MRVYSWNMLYKNKRLDRAFSFIHGLEFDILCLQEVPERFLPLLSALPYEMVSTTDAVMRSRRRETAMYIVILSRFPIRASGAVPFPELRLPARTRWLLKAKEGRLEMGARNALYADIDAGSGPVRIFSIHFTLSSPSARERELAVVERFLPKRFPAVLAGDLNIIEHPAVKPLNWIVGSRLSESLPWHRERSHVEKRFLVLGLKNPLRGRKTHGFSRSQLDHILVPKGSSVSEAKVVRRTYGSDHHPVVVACDLSRAM